MILTSGSKAEKFMHPEETSACLPNSVRDKYMGSG